MIIELAGILISEHETTVQFCSYEFKNERFKLQLRYFSGHIGIFYSLHELRCHQWLKTKTKRGTNEITVGLYTLD